ncbi:unnamed protein product [Acanthosepion pharaonis]|uniref:Uncharacterized protein n=1 Tax=Acanthosepion pharaonis TaxID=158019 RepID=A0A812EDN8_ACAPH|nr:unnamed protein product [Sepia pharaonis]
MRSLKFRHLITLYFRWLPLELFSLHQSPNPYLSLSQIPSSNHALLSLAAFGTLFPPSKAIMNSFPSIKAIMVSQIPSSSLYFRWLPFGTLFPPSAIMSLSNSLYFRWLPLELFPPSSHYRSLKFRHLITLYFRWLPLNSFPSIKAYVSQIPSSNHALLSLVALRLFSPPKPLWVFSQIPLFPPSKPLWISQIPSSNQALLSLVCPLELFSPPSKPYESLKFRLSQFHHLITLYFRWLPLELFPSIKAIMESLKFRHLITLSLSFLVLHQPLRLFLSKFRHLIRSTFVGCLASFPLHQSHYDSLKFLSQIPSSNHIYFRWLPFELFLPLLAIMSLSNSVINHALLSLSLPELFSLHRIMVSSSNPSSNALSTFVGCLWNSFPSIKAITVLLNSFFLHH